MHIYAVLKAVSGIELPITYNHFVQAAIYQTIDTELAEFLHEKGYEAGNRTFKLFSFSRLSGRFELNKEKGSIKFYDDIYLTISSPVQHFCQSIANGLLTKDYIYFGKNKVKLEKIFAQEFKMNKENVLVNTLSPIVVYSTFLRPDGRKYTCYFQPGEPDYNSLITNNLVKKYRALHGKDAPQGEVKVLARGDMRLHVVNYKKTVIKGYSGKLELTGPTELLQMAVDAGLGSKNSQGFGCVNIMERR
ncbi:MAG: CRISPR-associated endoribonuclease Cas6 [Desulfitobacteriaceae bacterium]|nr:CRISPR-associated endoribonuclease Cas6 [Desulfitobacteriaceae bacterium]MDD4752746.1 CRISPR-associated endoribonuclease Cas6 [Desulfitobacteriaceae bacterium]